MKLISLLQRHVPHIPHTPFFQSHLLYRTFIKTTLQNHPKPSTQVSYTNPCFTLLGFCSNIDFLKRIHVQLIVHGLTDNLLCQTKLITLYGVYGNTEQARLVFNGIRQPDFYSWKVMIRWYFLNNSYSEIIMFYRCLRQCCKEQDNVVFSIVLKACTESLDLGEGRKLHCQIVKVGNPDDFVLTGLLDMYAKCGEIGYSRRVFDEIPERNVVPWTSMIVGYVQNDCEREGLILFNEMRQELTEPNEFTMGGLLTAYSKLDCLHQGKWVHGFMIKKGIDLNSIVVTPLLDMYVKCGTVTDARSVFDDLLGVDVVSWTAMIVGYTQRSYPTDALKLFTDKRWAGLMPNSVTLASLLSACSQLGNSNLGRSIHMLGIKLGLEEDVAVRNACIDMYAKCSMIEDASRTFEKILLKNVIAWNSMITGYSQNGFGYKALLLFNRMRSEYLVPDAVTVVSALSACACLGSMLVGTSFHAYAVKNGFEANIHVGTALLNLYSKCGIAESARNVFDSMREKNMVTWSAMMGGYGMHGDTNGSLALFSEMLKENLQPNDVIFTSILSACSHTGMVGEGWKYFDRMCQDYHVIPSTKHYVCMVDLLARAGRLEDALEFIERMPIRADVSVWSALLHGCRLHSKLEIGQVAARRMMELQPDSAGYYVLVSNLYASDGRWDEAAKVRKLMKERGLDKLPGFSSVEMDNSLQNFAVKQRALP